jgi:hypothetical protein
MTETYKKPNGFIRYVILFWLLKILLVCGLVIVIWSNIEPYSNWVLDHWILDYINVPLHGSFVSTSFFGPLLEKTWIFGGVVFWAIVQSGKVMSLLLLGSPLELKPWKWIKLICYLIDFTILIHVIPFLKDSYNYQDIFTVLSLGYFDAIDWNNVIYLILAAYTLEFVVWMWKFLDRHIYLIRRGLKD